MDLLCSIEHTHNHLPTSGESWLCERLPMIMMMMIIFICVVLKTLFLNIFKHKSFFHLRANDNFFACCKWKRESKLVGFSYASVGATFEGRHKTHKHQLLALVSLSSSIVVSVKCKVCVCLRVCCAFKLSWVSVCNCCSRTQSENSLRIGQGARMRTMSRPRESTVGNWIKRPTARAFSLSFSSSWAYRFQHLHPQTTSSRRKQQQQPRKNDNNKSLFVSWAKNRKAEKKHWPPNSGLFLLASCLLSLHFASCCCCSSI